MFTDQIRDDYVSPAQSVADTVNRGSFARWSSTADPRRFPVVF